MALTVYAGQQFVDRDIVTVDQNDRWFGVEYLSGDLDIKPVAESLMQAIDRAVYVGDKVMDTPFGKGVNLRYLSTGCKTAMNIQAFPDVCFDTLECGNNAIFEILKLQNGKLILTGGFFFPVELDEDEDDVLNNILYIDHFGEHTFTSVNQLRMYIDGEPRD